MNEILFFDLTSVISDLIIFILVIGILFYLGLFMVKLALSKSRDKKGTKPIKEFIKKIEKGLKTFYGFFFYILGMLLRVFIAVILAIGSKPIILKLNYAYGESYATFASYAIAVLLYILLPEFWKPKEWKEERE